MPILDKKDIELELLGPGVERYAIVDGTQGADSLSVGDVKIEPGSKAPTHFHPTEEAMVILEGELDIDEIPPDEIESNLYTSDLPQSSPDMVLRTSGEKRLSGFLLWQSAYSELVFMDIMWPEFRKIDLLRAVRIYQRRRRRMGR